MSCALCYKHPSVICYTCHQDEISRVNTNIIELLKSLKYNTATEPEQKPKPTTEPTTATSSSCAICHKYSTVICLTCHKKEIDELCVSANNFVSSMKINH